MERGYIGNTNTFICLSDRTRGRIPIDLGWEYFGDFTTSYAYHMGPWQQTTTDGKAWLKTQVARWNARFIVAACPWHRHLWQGWTKTNTAGWGSRQTKMKDLALRYDNSVDTFIWPGQNWEEESASNCIEQFLHFYVQLELTRILAMWIDRADTAAQDRSVPVLVVSSHGIGYGTSPHIPGGRRDSSPRRDRRRYGVAANAAIGVVCHDAELAASFAIVYEAQSGSYME